MEIIRRKFLVRVRKIHESDKWIFILSHVAATAEEVLEARQKLKECGWSKIQIDAAQRR